MAGMKIMTIKRRPLNTDGTRLERRRSTRYAISVPIEVSWRGAGGIAIKQDAVALQANVNGAFLRMSVHPEFGARVSLANFLSAQTAEARVVAVPGAREGVVDGIAVELVVPNESFWGVDLQVKKAGVELRNLEKAMQQEAIDLRVLAEYREAVDYIRKAAGMVRQLRECQLRGGDEGEILSLLAADRIQRTLNLCMEVMADLGAGRVKPGSSGGENLYHTLENLRNRLRRVVQIDESLKKLGFSHLLIDSLNAAERSLQDTANAFDLKSCLGHLRSFLEQLHLEACLRFVRSGETSPADWGPATTFLCKCGVLSPKEEAFLSALYAWMGDEATHPMFAEREYARVFMNVVVEYSLLFLAALQKQGTKNAVPRSQITSGPSQVAAP